MSEPTRLLLCNPDDIYSIADAKAKAAEYGTTVELSRAVPLGTILSVDPDLLKPLWP